MTRKNPYLHINNKWLSLHKEKPFLPKLKIIDPHHHLWNLNFGKYLHDDFARDILNSGHNVEASVYIMSSANNQIYDKKSPKEFETLPEINFAYNESIKSKKIKKNKCLINNSIIGGIDLRFGKKIQPVIEKSLQLSNNRLKGFRMLLAAHNNEIISSGAVKVNTGLMLDPNFLEGAKILQNFNLSLDFWIYHTQLGELELIARSLPNLSIILNHIGGPIHIGPYFKKKALTHREWRKSMMRLAKFPNIKVKLGGLGMRVCGAFFDFNPMPPSSDHLSNLWRSWIYETINLFGTERCMFESNFPVDKGSFSYGVLWNAFKKITMDFSDDEKKQLFYKNALNTYKIEL